MKEQRSINSMSKEKRKLKLDLVRVTWLDAYEEPSGWLEPKILDTVKCSECISYGLMYKRKDAIVLFGDVAKDISSEIGRLTIIPKGWIKDIKYFGIQEEIILSGSLE